MTRFFAVVILLLGMVSSANATYMDCLEKSRGRLLRWNSNWDSDRSDNGVNYRITAVEVYNRLPDRFVTLQLSAASGASRSRRTYKVETEEKARALCQNLVVEQRTLTLPHERGIVAKEDTSETSARNVDLPFILYTSDGWVRDFPPPGRPLEVCRVLEQRFSCLPDQKRKFSQALKDLEEELRARVENP